jgi:hypothetical protein
VTEPVETLKSDTCPKIDLRSKDGGRCVFKLSGLVVYNDVAKRPADIESVQNVLKIEFGPTGPSASTPSESTRVVMDHWGRPFVKVGHTEDRGKLYFWDDADGVWMLHADITSGNRVGAVVASLVPRGRGQNWSLVCKRQKCDELMK